MRMMKNNRNETIMVIGIDHGYGNMKTATEKIESDVCGSSLSASGICYKYQSDYKEVAYGWFRSVRQCFVLS